MTQEIKGATPFSLANTPHISCRDWTLIDDHFCDLFSHCFEDALRIINSAEVAGRTFQYHSNVKTVAFSENGMPQFQAEDTVRNYTLSFKDFEDVTSIPSFKTLVNYASQNERLREYFDFAGDFDDQSAWWVFRVVLEAVDRYIHLFNRFDFEQSLLEQIYVELERALFVPRLPVDIVIPIPYVEFQFDDLTMGDNVKIWRMDASFQKARIASLLWSNSDYSRLVAPCSHALVLQNWNIPNDHYLRTAHLVPSLGTEATNILETFFASLRIIFNAETGYAQVVLKPNGWLARMEADLPSVTSDTLRGYPRYLEFEHPRTKVMVTREKGVELGSLFQQLTGETKTNVVLAVKRLNRALLRDHEEDSILDATIAMEALLSPENSPEITHRLKLRMAALAKMSDTHSTRVTEILRNIPKIYEYRSSVIHGNAEPHKKREIHDVDRNIRIPTVDLALDYLKMAMAVLGKNPEFLDPKRIDTELLLGVNE